jgi:hypothetical protein
VELGLPPFGMGPMWGADIEVLVGQLIQRLCSQCMCWLGAWGGCHIVYLSASIRWLLRYMLSLWLRLVVNFEHGVLCEGAAFPVAPMVLR